MTLADWFGARSGRKDRSDSKWGQYVLFLGLNISQAVDANAGQWAAIDVGGIMGTMPLHILRDPERRAAWLRGVVGVVITDTLAWVNIDSPHLHQIIDDTIARQPNADFCSVEICR